jgi:hypothetical protein
MDHTRRAYETVTASALAVGIVAIIGVLLRRKKAATPVISTAW